MTSLRASETTPRRLPSEEGQSPRRGRSEAEDRASARLTAPTGEVVFPTLPTREAVAQSRLTATDSQSQTVTRSPTSRTAAAYRMRSWATGGTVYQCDSTPWSA